MTLPHPSVPIPANKYFPPRFLPGMTLQRSQLVQLMAAPPTPYQFIFLEAQAGQGKTIIAAQFQEQLGLPFLWYQSGPEDRDPIVFLCCLLNGFRKTLEGFSSPIPQTHLENGQADLVDLPQLAQMFCQDLTAALAPRNQRNGQAAVLVLDDVHLLEASEKSLGLLDLLLESFPDTLAVMLLSRSPLPLRSKRVRFERKTLYLSNRELAMTRDEGVNLLALLLPELPEPIALSALLQQAGGWPMGLVLASQNYAAGSAGLEWRQETASSYLERELLTTLEPSQRFVAQQLALLDEIPLGLAQQISPDADVAQLLHILVAHNFFLRFLNNEGTLFGFHHLFLSFLQQKAKTTLTGEEQARVYSLAAAYYLDHKRPGKAMEYQIKGQDFPALEQSLEHFGQALLAKGRHVTLHTLLAAIPEERIHQSAWFSYFLGLTLQVHEPLAALRAFHRARTIFHEAGHSKGELLTTANILYLYIIHSATLPRAEALHPDAAHALYERAGAELPPFCRITTTHNIALGYLYFLNDFEKTRHYNDLTRELAIQSKLPNMLLASKLASGWSYNMSGELDRAIAIVEHNYRLINRKELGFHNRMQLFLFQLDITRTIGGINNYIKQRDEFVGWAGADTINRTFAAPWLVLWELELACECGDFPQLGQIIETHINAPSFQLDGNFRGELHAWLALYLAKTGTDTEKIEACLEESRRCMQGGISPKHFIRIALLIGQVHHLLGQPSEALQHFEQVKSTAGRCGMLHMLAWASLLQALTLHQVGELDRMELALREGVNILLQKQRYTLLSGFSPDTALRVLRLAHDAGIQPEFCRKYAWDILHTAIAGKRDIPLVSLQILGRLAFALPGQEPRDMSQTLSQIQRKFLGLLLGSTGMSVSQLQIQSALWPEIPENKARQRFDTLMTRLRKTLAEIVFPLNIEDYLLMEKGVVSLRNCRVDSVEFCALVEQGLRELHLGNWWQAGNSFTKALQLWHGSPVVELLELDNGSSLIQQSIHCLSSMAQDWCPALLELDRNEQAEMVCETAWNENKSNQKLTRQLYEMKITSGATVQGCRIMDAFAAASRELGLDEKRVEESVHQITSFAE